VLIAPPTCRMGPITPAERAAVTAVSPVKDAYDRAVDRASAYETLTKRAQERTVEAPPARGPSDTGRGRAQPRPSQRQTMTEAAAKSAVRSVTSAIGSSLGRALVRGVLGSLLKR